jgi:hypothetical protein
MENLGTTVHERKKGQGNLWQGNKTKVMSVIPLPIIPLPMTLLDDPPPTRGDSNSRVGIQRLANNLDASALTNMHLQSHCNVLHCRVDALRRGIVL